LAALRFIRGSKSVDTCPDDSCRGVNLPRIVFLLRDRGTVAIQNAGDSQLDVKNAEIEANGNETQGEKGLEDNIHGHGFCGENRTQL
jgi:hypothetical protein